MHFLAFSLNICLLLLVMPFFDKLDGLVAKAEARITQHRSSGQQQPQQYGNPYQQGYASPQQQHGNSYQQPMQNNYASPQQQHGNSYQQAMQGYYAPSQQQQQQQQQYPGNAPPPIPTHSKPGNQGSSAINPVSVYWTYDTSSPISSTFDHKTGQHGWGNNELQNYTDLPQNSFYASSSASQQPVLILQAIASSNAPSQETKYTSARLVSRQTLSRSRGYLHIRATAPIARGIWPAIWLLPKEPFSWPGDGECDIMEVWNGERINHSCLHWGQFNGEDWNKHRVIETPDVQYERPEGVTFGLAWEESPKPGDRGERGRIVWYINGKAVMKAKIPDKSRRFEEMQYILNVAMGGNVCGGALPADGTYQLVVHELKMCAEPVGGWQAFDRDWQNAREGHP